MIQLRPHQETAVMKLHNGCILWGGVGSGKTYAALGYFYQEVCGGDLAEPGSAATPIDVYVITTAKKRDSLDWQEAALNLRISDDPELSPDEIQLTVDSWNNIRKYEGVQNAFFIFDEQRLVGSGAWTKSFIKVAKHNQWILLSATPGDNWLDYIPVFVANGFYKNRTQFKREHVVYNTFTKFPKVDHYLGEAKLLRLRDSIRVHMPYESHAKRNTIEITVDFDRHLMDRVVKDRWHVYEQRPLKGVAEMFYVMRKIANSDSSRIQTIRMLMREHPRLIVFYNFDYELELLRTLAEPDSVSSTDSKMFQSQHSTSSTRTSKHSKKKQNTRQESSSETDTTSSQEPGTDLILNGTHPDLDVTAKDAEPSSTTCTSKEEKWETSTSSSTKQSPSLKNTSTSSEQKSTESQRSTDSGPEKGQTAESVRTTGSKSSSNHDLTSLKKEKDSTTTLSVAEWNGHRHQRIPDTDRWVYLVQYQAGSEGWNCITTDTIVFFSLTYSYKMWHQAHGRIDRLNTPYQLLNYYVLKSNAWIDIVISKALRMKRNFQESQYRDVG